MTDTTGAVIPNAEVRIRETSTNQSRALVTGENGAFRLPDLPPGTYEVSAAREGFAPYFHTGVVITLGSAVHLDIVLMPAGLSEQVSVTGQPPPLDPSQSSVTSTIDFERIEELPVRSRNYLDLSCWHPESRRPIHNRTAQRKRSWRIADLPSAVCDPEATTYRLMASIIMMNSLGPTGRRYRLRSSVNFKSSIADFRPKVAGVPEDRSTL